MSYATESANNAPSGTVLELLVRNHPGVMSHICGLFSRRAYNMEGILCLPVGDATQSRIWLLVREDERLPQIIKQVQKLQDVSDVRRRPLDPQVLGKIEEFFQAGSPSLQESLRA